MDKVSLGILILSGVWAFFESRRKFQRSKTSKSEPYKRPEINRQPPAEPFYTSSPVASQDTFVDEVPAEKTRQSVKKAVVSTPKRQRRRVNWRKAIIYAEILSSPKALR